MVIQKKILLSAVGLIACLLASQILLPHEDLKNTNAQLRIGAGDDISGYLVNQILDQEDNGIKLAVDSMEGYEFKDC